MSIVRSETLGRTIVRENSDTTMAINTNVNQTFSFTTQLASTGTTFVLNRLEYRID